MSSERLRANMEEDKDSTGGKNPARRWSDDEKLAIVRECDLPGSSVSMVSRRHDINSNLIFNWRSQVRRGVLGIGKAVRPLPALVPVTIVDDRVQQLALPPPSSPVTAAPPPPKPSPPPAPAATGRIEIEMPSGVRVRFDSTVSAAALRNVLASLAVQS